jgi:hypothetical protein
MLKSPSAPNPARAVQATIELLADDEVAAEVHRLVSDV